MDNAPQHDVLPGETFRLVVEAAPTAIVGADSEGRIVLVNRQAEALFGYRREELVGRSIDTLVPAAARASHERFRAAFQAAPETRPMGAGRDLHALRRDGTEFPVEIGLNPVATAHGTWTLATIVDIGARKRAEEALREADRRKDEFLSVLAHELRNPLAPLASSLEVLRLASGDPERAKRAREIMSRQVRQMSRLIDDLLDVARINRGVLSLRRARIEMHEVLKAALEVVEGLIAARGHTLHFACPETGLAVDADHIRLTQVFANLLNNAARYTPAGGRISVHARRDGDRVRVIVSDTGVGLPADKLEAIFEMFTRVQPPGFTREAGLGIGLSVARRLVDMHDGTIRARSDGLGRGAEFVVDLPAARSVATQVSETTAAQSDGEKLRVLVVDDNADAAVSTATLLQALGHETRTAYDGAQGVSEAESFRPDLVLLDLAMPVMDGFQAARLMRQRDWGRSTRIAALTGWGQEETRRRTEEAGFDDHFVKPVQVQDLVELLQSVRAASRPNA